MSDIREQAVELFRDHPKQLFTATGVALVIGRTPTAAQELLDQLEADGVIESVEFAKHAIQRRRYRWLEDQ